MYHNSGNIFKFISFHFYKQVLSIVAVPGTVQATCTDLLFFESLTNFLEYCFPHFQRKISDMSKVT